MPDSSLRIVAVGGLGEIGRNMTVFSHGEAHLIVDCGVLFPRNDAPGVDLVLPDMEAVSSQIDAAEAIFLTHGHEDHIGGLPFLLRRNPRLELIGSRFTLALARRKLAEAGLDPRTREVREGQTTSVGPFDLRFFAVNHSVPDGLAVGISTPAGVVLHTGDFKLDQTPLDGRLTDLTGFAELGLSGIDLLMSDSTNADVPGFIMDERAIAPSLRDVMTRARGRVIVACFASHVHRVQQVIDAASFANRKVAFIGRSMVRNMAVARDLGLLQVPNETMVSETDAAALDPSEVVLLSTGSQGEPLSALSRMARGRHRITVREGDVVLFSARLIPGNETDVFRVINTLSRQRITVLHQGHADVHASGHAPAGELRHLITLTRPKNLLPVHGEWRHLHAHAELAYESGMARESVHVLANGDVLELVDGRASVIASVPVKRVYVGRGLEGDLPERVLEERRQLATSGALTVSVVLDVLTDDVVGQPEVSFVGTHFSKEQEEEIRQATVAATDSVSGVLAEEELEQVITRAIGRHVRRRSSAPPLIVVTVLQIAGAGGQVAPDQA